MCGSYANVWIYMRAARQQSLTVIGDQALARSKQQMHFTASCLDQLNCPSVRDALGGLAVDLHYLVSNLWCR